MKISTIAIGDELLIGQVTDTNTGEIARRFAEINWEVAYSQVIGDSTTAINSAIDHAFSVADVVLMTGGLGPTKDDITKATLLARFGGEMVFDSSVEDNIKRVFNLRGLTMNELTRRQAEVPSSCRVIQNRVGTAPVMWFDFNGKTLISMPGVPFEMRAALEDIIPELERRHPISDSIIRRTLLVTGITESDLAIRLRDWENRLPAFAHLAYLPQPGLIRLRLDFHINNPLTTDAEALFNDLKALVGDNLLHDEDTTLEELLLQELKKRHLTIGTAESCTGGNIAHRITSVAGSSKAFDGGIIAYSNKVKIRQLEVNPDILAEFGAVSREVVNQMVGGTCRNLAVDCAIATSGIAGPGGGTPDKPVGTVCVAVKTPLRTVSMVHHFPGNRARVIQHATNVALITAIREIRLLGSEKSIGS